MLSIGNTTYGPQFTFAPDGTVSLTTTPLPIGGGTITGPVVITTNTAPTLPAPPAGTLLNIAAADNAVSRLTLDAFGSNGSLVFRRANGTVVARSALNLNDQLVAIAAFGYGASGYSSAARISIGANAAQAWTDTGQGTFITFNVTPNNTLAQAEVMRIADNGNVGIGTNAPPSKLTVSTAISGASPAPAGIVQFAAIGEAGGAQVHLDSYGSNSSFFTARRSRGTAAAPTAVLNGDNLMVLTGVGRGASVFGASATINFTATENWTDTAFGTMIRFGVTQTGSTVQSEAMRIADNGFVGIGINSPPTNQLDVNAGANVTAARFRNTAAGIGGLYVMSNADNHFLLSGGAEYTGGAFICRANSASQVQASGGSLAFFTDGGLTVGGTYTPTQRVTISNVGNVGVGVTSPTFRLHLGTSATGNFPAIGIVGSTIYNAYATINNTGAQFVLGVEGSGGATLVVGGLAYSAVVNNQLAAPLQFGTNNTVRMTFDAAGNTQIGPATGTISRKFEVWNGLSSAGIGSMRLYGYQPSFELFNFAGTSNWYFGINDADLNKLYIGPGYGPNQGLAPSIVCTAGGGNTVMIGAANLPEDARLVIYGSVNSKFALTYYNNTPIANMSAMPFAPGYSSLGWNMSAGGAEMDFINRSDSGVRGFSFWQQTGTGTFAHIAKMTQSNGFFSSGCGQFTGITSPASGVGCEIGYDSGNLWGFVLAYDRGAGQYRNLYLGGATIDFALGGAEVARFAANKCLGIGTVNPRTLIEIAAAGNPGIALTDTSGSTDNKTWDWIASGSQFQGRLINDAYNLGTQWIVVSRTGQTVQTVQFPAGIVIMNGDGLSNTTIAQFRAGTAMSVAGQTGQIEFGTVGGVKTGIVRMLVENSTQISYDFWAYNGGIVQVIKLHPNGTCYNSTGVWTAYSDRSEKQDIEDWKPGLEAIKKLRPVKYRRKAGATFAPKTEPSEPMFGLIADEVKQYLPEIVGSLTYHSEDLDSDPNHGKTLETVTPGYLIYVLINAMKEMSDKIDRLESKTIH